MTTLVSQPTTSALTVDAGFFVRALAGLREMGNDCASAVRASAASPHPVGMDPAVLLLLGRS